MKQLCLAGMLMACVFAAQSQPLITYGKNTVSVDEFMRAYNKNKIQVKDDGKALREYLDLYTNFKLKVNAASEMKIDTLPHIRSDVKNFRQQVQDNYLTDERSMAFLYDEAFARSQKDIHVIHFSVPVLPGALPADTLKAFNAQQKLYAAVKSGVNYQDAVQKASEISPARLTDLGFITVFTLPYTYENIIYSLKPGEVSVPYRSKNAWHIFKVVEDRPAAGKWKVAQILFSIEPGVDAALMNETIKLADSVYNLLRNGADFANAAQNYSDDKLTYLAGGELPEFGTGKFDLTFEKEVFKLKKDGDLTPPFITPHGIHIVKRLGQTSLSSDKNDASAQYELKQKIQQDSRIELYRARFAKEMAVKTGMKKLAAIKDADLFRYADSVLLNANISAIPISKKPLLQFKKKTVNADDWLHFVVNYKGNPERYRDESNKELLEKYMLFAAIEYYKDNMEEYNPDFRFQMKEFLEGNMLFEIMEKKVWGKAAEDSAGLMNYYTAHREKYKWEKSADVLIFNIADIRTAESIYNTFRQGMNWRQLAEDHAASIQVDSGRYELSQLSGTGTLPEPAAGSLTQLIRNSDGTASFIKYLHVYPGNEPRSFEEAKGLVINDYQGVLEEMWVAELRKKYPVKINEAALKTLLK